MLVKYFKVYFHNGKKSFFVLQLIQNLYSYTGDVKINRDRIFKINALRVTWAKSKFQLQKATEVFYMEKKDY